MKSPLTSDMTLLPSPPQNSLHRLIALPHTATVCCLTRVTSTPHPTSTHPPPSEHRSPAALRSIIMKWYTSLPPALPSSVSTQPLISEAAAANDADGAQEAVSAASSVSWREKVSCTVATMQARAGGCRPLLQLLSAHVDSALYVESACEGLSSRLLSHVSSPGAPPPRPYSDDYPPDHTSFGLELVRLGGVSVLLDAMDKHAAEPDCLAALCHTLQGCCDLRAAAVVSAVWDGAVDSAVVGVLRRYPQHCRLQEEGGAVLHHLCVHTPRQRPRVIRAGGVDLLLQAIAAHPTSAMVQSNALGLLLCCSVNRPGVRMLNGAVQQSEEEQRACVELFAATSAHIQGSSQAMSVHLACVALSALQSHSTHTRTHYYAMALLESHLVALHSTGDVHLLSHVISPAHVLNTLISSVREVWHGHVEPAQKQSKRSSYLTSLRVLSAVPLVDTTRRQLDRTVLMSLVDNTNPTYHGVDIVRTALRVLDQLIRPFESVNLAVVRRGGLRFTVHALKEHPLDVDIQLAACGILAHLSQSGKLLEAVRCSVEEGNGEPDVEGDGLNAAFIGDVTLADGIAVRPGQALQKVWQVRNTGDKEWPAGTRLQFIGGDVTPVGGEADDATSWSEVPTAAPGQAINLVIDIQTPPQLGRFRGSFRLVTPDGNRFGPRIWIDVDVTDLDVPQSSASAASTASTGAITEQRYGRDLLALDVLQALTATLSHHNGHPGVQLRALTLIRCLLYEVMTVKRRKEERLITAPLVRAIVVAIDSARGSEAVQERGCQLLEELCHATANTSERRRRRKRLVVEADGVAVLQAVQRQSPQPRIRCTALSAISIITNQADRG